jgi:integrase
MAKQHERVSHRTVCNLYISIACFLHSCGVDHKKLLPQSERLSPVEETPEAYTQEEMTKFFFVITKERDALAFELMRKTGPREQELANLEWGHLDLGKNPTAARPSPHRTAFRIGFGRIAEAGQDLTTSGKQGEPSRKRLAWLLPAALAAALALAATYFVTRRALVSGKLIKCTNCGSLLPILGSAGTIAQKPPDASGIQHCQSKVEHTAAPPSPHRTAFV